MIAYLFVMIALTMRFLPHPLAFTPIGAALLFFGATRGGRHGWIPVAMLTICDIILTRVVYGYSLSPDHVVTWAWYAVMLLIGTRLGSTPKPGWLISACAVGAVTFFVTSNLAVWVCWQMYPRTFSGLLACYVSALPFFRNELLAEVVFSGLFFGIGAMLCRGNMTFSARQS